MTIPRSTNQCGLLERTETIQTTIILNMGGKTLLTNIKLTRDLTLSTLGELTTEVDIHEVEPRTPLVGLELLEG